MYLLLSLNKTEVMSEDERDVLHKHYMLKAGNFSHSCQIYGKQLSMTYYLPDPTSMYITCDQLVYIHTLYTALSLQYSFDPLHSSICPSIISLHNYVVASKLNTILTLYNREIIL